MGEGGRSVRPYLDPPVAESYITVILKALINGDF